MSRYGKQFIEEALKLSDEVGLKQATVQLGLPYPTLADWRSSCKRHNEILLSHEDREIRLREHKRESAKL